MLQCVRSKRAFDTRHCQFCCLHARRLPYNRTIFIGPSIHCATLASTNALFEIISSCRVARPCCRLYNVVSQRLRPSRLTSVTIEGPLSLMIFNTCVLKSKYPVCNYWLVRRAWTLGYKESHRLRPSSSSKMLISAHKWKDWGSVFQTAMILLELRVQALIRLNISSRIVAT